MNLDKVREVLCPTGALRAGIAVGPAASALWATTDRQTGRPAGVTVDLATAMAEALSTPLDLVVFKSSGEIIAAAQADRWDVAFTPVDAERKTKVDFGTCYFLGESTYLVLKDCPIRHFDEVDRTGVRIVGVENTATIRSLRRATRAATAIGTTSLDEAVARLVAGEADALALGRESLASLESRLPGSRILDGAFHRAGTAIAVQKGKPLALEFASDFIERAKREGIVRRAFDAHGMQDASVAPPGALP